jgi:8-amino-7-oxononanoate synthase
MVTRMLDFSSSLYLGLCHASRSLDPWDRLTNGKPSALAEPPGAAAVAAALAALIGGERAVLVPSTLHLFWDLFGIRAGGATAIYVDAGAYPIARWGVARAATRGVAVRYFNHHDGDDLRRHLTQGARTGVRPLVVADGFCPGCSRPAPVSDYLDAARTFGGSLLIDDTQALGIFGHSPGLEAPYGHAGGGTLRRRGLAGPDVLIGASLAKAFGTPVAVLSGGAVEVRRFIAMSETRVHCSPPSVATIHAAAHALEVNRTCGDALRFRLAALVGRFRARLAEHGLAGSGGIFPVQRVAVPIGHDALSLYQQMLRLGVRAVLVRGGPGHGPGLSFLINARQHPCTIDRAVAALASALRSSRLVSRSSDRPAPRPSPVGSGFRS